MRPGPVHGLLSSLQFRLVLGFALTLALALTAVGVFIGLATERQTERFESDQELAQAGRVSRFITNSYVEEHAWTEPGDELQSIVEEASSLSGLRVTLFDAQGTVVADSNAPSSSISTSNPDLADGASRDITVGDAEDGGPEHDGRALPVFNDGEVVGSLIVSGDSAPDPDWSQFGLADPEASGISAFVNRYLLWAGIGAAVVGTALVWVLSQRVLAPLQSLGATARRLGRGELSQRAETAGPTEVRQLAHSFNAMAAELEEAERRRRSLTADVAHELRTPTSNIQGYLEAIRDGVFQPTPETLAIMHEQALLLSRLVEDLRLLAQVDAEELQLQRTQTPLAGLLQSCLNAIRPRADAKGVALHLEVASSLPALDMDAARIAQVVGNLLDNAVTHTPEGGRVTVSARAVGDAVETEVADTGQGIAPEDLPRVFDRFYRTDPSRARSTGGTGLGLAIARRIVDAHGGSIRAESVLGQGSRFVMLLPTGT